MYFHILAANLVSNVRRFTILCIIDIWSKSGTLWVGWTLDPELDHGGVGWLDLEEGVSLFELGLHEHLLGPDWPGLSFWFGSFILGFVILDLKPNHIALIDTGFKVEFRV